MCYSRIYPFSPYRRCFSATHLPPLWKFHLKVYFSYLFIHSLARSLARSLTHSLTQSLTHSRTRALTHSRTHARTHAHTHPPTPLALIHGILILFADSASVDRVVKTTDTVIEGDTFSLTCEVSGDPEPNVTWFTVSNDEHSY